MKPIISLITGILLISLIGCNNTNRDNENPGSRAVSPEFDTNETVVEPTNDNTTSTEMDTDEATASDQSSQAEQPEGDTIYIETEVVQIDTVATEMVYDVNRRTIEQVDTVGATATHKVERKVIKRTIIIDTLTETVDKEQNVVYEEGNYQVVDEQVEQDTVIETINHPTADESNVRVNNNQALEDEEVNAEQEIITEQNQNITTQQSQDTTTIEQSQNTDTQQNQNTTNEQDTTIESRVPNQSVEQDTTKETTGDTSN